MEQRRLQGLWVTKLVMIVCSPYFSPSTYTASRVTETCCLVVCAFPSTSRCVSLAALARENGMFALEMMSSNRAEVYATTEQHLVPIYLVEILHPGPSTLDFVRHCFFTKNYIESHIVLHHFSLRNCFFLVNVIGSHMG